MIAVIADDLTGAAELGAVGLRFGLRAEVVVGGTPSGTADLVCFDTDSRSCAPAEAGRRAAMAAQMLSRSGASWIYKKTDSVLRGQVTAELEAVLQQLGLKLALLVPANPSLGRVIRAGRYWVRGQLLHETEFARDPEHPRHSAEVLELLGASEFLSVKVLQLGEPVPEAGILVGNVESAEEMGAWAAQRHAGMLPAGGAEFFGALLAACTPARQPAGVPARAPNRELFVSGTTSESSRAFVGLAREQGVPVFSLPEELAQGVPFAAAAADTLAQAASAALKSHRRVILTVGLPAVPNRAVAGQLSAYLAQVAEQVLQRGAVDQVYVEGGATAASLVARTGCTCWQVRQELAPGVVTLAAEQRPGLQLTIKPGSYAWPEPVRGG